MTKYMQIHHSALYGWHAKDTAVTHPQVSPGLSNERAEKEMTGNEKNLTKQGVTPCTDKSQASVSEGQPSQSKLTLCPA